MSSLPPPDAERLGALSRHFGFGLSDGELAEFGPAVETASLGPSAADDPMVVFDLTDQVRETIQQTLYSLLLQRRSAFF